MTITIRYFGLMADLIGKSEESLAPESGVNTIAALQSQLEMRYPQITQARYSFAVNQSIANAHTALHHNDEIALLPPFAGG